MKHPYRLLILVLTPLILAGCIGHVPSTVLARRDIVYGEGSGQPLHLDLYEPKQPVGKLPVVIWLHGGGWNRGSKNRCPIAFLASSNAAIVSLEYRLDTVAPFPAPMYDCKGAVRWIRAHASEYQLDPERIGLFGASAGAHLALLVATTPDNKAMEGDVGGNLDQSSKVQCVCAFYPPTELNRLVTDPATRENPKADVAMLIGGPVAEHVAQAEAASPLNYVTSNCPPIFLMHGDADTVVPIEQSQWFYAALKKNNVPCQFEILPDKNHGAIPTKPVARQIYNFFNRYLGTQLTLKD